MESNINNLIIGTNQEITLLIQRIEKAVAKNGNIYQKIYVRDSCDHESIILNFENLLNLQTPVVIQAKLDVAAYNEGMSIPKLAAYTIDTKTSSYVFMPKSKIDMHAYWNKLVTITKTLDTVYQRLITKTLMKDQKKFLYYPLTQSKAYSRLNGLLEATVSLMELAERVSDVLPTLNKNLLVTAAALYYVGNMDTLNESFCENEDEFLFGSAIPTYNRIMEAYKEIQKEQENTNDSLKEIMDTETIKLVCHIIIGRCKGMNTIIPEASVLKHLDAVIVETDGMTEVANKCEPGTTACYNGKKIYRPSNN